MFLSQYLFDLYFRSKMHCESRFTLTEEPAITAVDISFDLLAVLVKESAITAQFWLVDILYVWCGNQMFCIDQDYIDTEALLNSENVNQEALLAYAREAADYATHYQLPTLDYATNHCGQPDVAMFDFTSMYASESAALVRERFGHSVLVALVGDSLLEVRRIHYCAVILK